MQSEIELARADFLALAPALAQSWTQAIALRAGQVAAEAILDDVS